MAKTQQTTEQPADDVPAVDQPIATETEQPPVVEPDTVAAEPSPAPEPVVASETVNVRILSDVIINDVAIAAGRVAALPNGVAAAYCDSGAADDDPAAVDYALGENADIVNPYAD